MKREGFFSLILSSFLLSAVGRDVPVPFTEGPGEALKIDPKIQRRINSLEWKRNGALLAEWVDRSDVKVEYYGKDFKNRTTLDVTTGVLMIKNAVPTDAGTFTLSLNNVEMDDVFVATFIKPLDKPKVHLSPVKCSAFSEKCTLHCNASTDDGAVEYFWKLQPGNQMEAGESQKHIDQNTSGVESFVCVVGNALKEKESDPISNPFYQDTSNTGTIVAVVVVLLLLVILALLIWYFCFRGKSGKDRRQNLIRFLSGRGSETKSESEGEAMNCNANVEGS